MRQLSYFLLPPVLPKHLVRGRSTHEGSPDCIEGNRRHEAKQADCSGPCVVREEIASSFLDSIPQGVWQVCCDGACQGKGCPEGQRHSSEKTECFALGVYDPEEEARQNCVEGRGLLSGLRDGR